MATTPQSTPTDLEFIGHIINDKLEAQPWGRKVANTVTALVGAVVTIAAGAMSMGINLPDWAMLTVICVTTLGTVLGVRETKNGFSDSQIEKLQQWQADYIDARHAHDEAAVTAAEAFTGQRTQETTEEAGRHALPSPSMDAAGLSEMVRRFLAVRER